MEPLEHSTSSEKDTLELVLDWRLEDDTDEDDTDDLSDLMGTTTGDSVLQYSRMRILTIANSFSAFTFTFKTILNYSWRSHIP